MAEEMDHISDLQKRLYTRDPDNIPKRRFGILRPVKQNVNSAWGKTEVEDIDIARKSGLRGIKRFFIFSLIFFVLAAGAMAFSIFRGAITLSSKNVDLEIAGNTFVSGGEELPLKIEVLNKNSADLLNAVLVLNYPRGAVDIVEGDTVRVERKLGVIQGGKGRAENFSVILHGEQGTLHNIRAVLTYNLDGSSALFQKESSFEVLINQSPLELTFDAPVMIAPDQTFTMTLRNRFMGENLLPNVRVRVDYPNGFVYQSSVPAPISGENIWTLGDLQSGDEQVIYIRGRIVGQIGDEKSFRVYVGTPENEIDNKIALTYSSTIHSLNLSRPFIASNIFINGESEDVVAVPIGQAVNGSINWENASGERITDAVFELLVDGEGVDFSKFAATSGYFDRPSRTVLWNSQSNSALSVVQPGQRGQLSFAFPVVQGVNPGDIKLTLSIRGVFPDRGYIEERISAIDEIAIRHASHIQFASQSFYSIGPIQNSGPFPPKVGEDTTYTITWTARPSENALSNYVVTSSLPDGVIWKNSFTPQSEKISYNPESRTVTWDAGSMPKAGNNSYSKNVTFQVQIRPTAEMVGSEVALLDRVNINAHDVSANVPINASRVGLTTRLSSDPAYGVGKEKVLP